MQGKAFLGKQARSPRRYAFAIRDRMAEWYATVRVVRDKDYQYHRNFMPHRSWTPFTSYTFRMPTAQVWTRLHEHGQLDPTQDRYFQSKPTEELYDLKADPHMLGNLADDPDHVEVLRRMRLELHDWQLRTRDLGLLSEYEMHRRAADSTQYDVGQDEQRYPLRRILPAAELAGQRDAGNLPALRELLDDREPSVRWWAALGLLMLDEQARPARSALTTSLKDDSPLVRVAAAESLFQLGHIEQARAALVDALVHPTPFVRLRAMNALYRMGGHARPALPAIEKASMEGIYPAEYLNRLVEYLPAELQK
jgi:hypothetical protein